MISSLIFRAGLWIAIYFVGRRSSVGGASVLGAMPPPVMRPMACTRGAYRELRVAK